MKLCLVFRANKTLKKLNKSCLSFQKKINKIYSLTKLNLIKIKKPKTLKTQILIKQTTLITITTKKATTKHSCSNNSLISPSPKARLKAKKELKWVENILKIKKMINLYSIKATPTHNKIYITHLFLHFLTALKLIKNPWNNKSIFLKNLNKIRLESKKDPKIILFTQVTLYK